MTRPLLIAGIGNLFLGDDAFGCEVLRRLCVSCTLRGADIELRDFGVGVRALGYALAARSTRGIRGTTVIVDALAAGCAPGTIQVLDLAAVQAPGSAGFDHTHDLRDALSTAVMLGGSLERTYLLGCEPASFEPAFSDAGEPRGLLSAAVEAAARRCVDLLVQLIEDPAAELWAMRFDRLGSRAERRSWP